MSNFSIYLIGIVFIACGLGLAAHLLGTPPLWIIVGVIIIVGIGIMAGVMKTRLKERSNTNN
jgi:hypothetical protein